VPVRVVAADADQPDRCRDLPVQLGILVGRAVVRDLHDLDGPARRAGAEQSSLRVLPEVAEEHAADAPTAVRTAGRPEHQAGSVPGVPAAGAGPEQPPPQRAEDPRRAVVPRSDVDPRTAQGPHHGRVRRATDRPHEGGRHTFRDRVDGAHVVAVEVGQDEQVDVPDPQEVEAPLQSLAVVTRVHERRPAVGRPVAD